jgi:hypothetical protein
MSVLAIEFLWFLKVRKKCPPNDTTNASNQPPMFDIRGEI